ncbi:MAG TPA: hypothetical protein VHL34_09680, partial [Rhizomicrobium sp.]|nr:hypothetical protein [Rhizomicrobium sp.]
IASVAYSFREGEDFQGHGDRLQTTMSNDIEGARAFLAKNYPQLAPRPEQGTYQMVPTKISCPL